MNRILVGILWAAIYLLLAAGPAFLMTLPPAPPGRDFWTELSIALGFIGLAQLALQFVLVARFRSITAPYGIDIILYYHRQIGAVSVLAILAHPAILFVRNPSMLSLLNPLGGTWASRAGLFAAVLLVLLLVLSWFRRQLRIGYEVWRISHTALALVALAVAVLHVAWIGVYVNSTAKLAFWIGFSALLVAPLAYLRLLKPFAERSARPYEVTEVRHERGRVWSLCIEPVGHAGMKFEPGQFVWLKLGSAFTIDEHPFSLSSSAEATGRLEFGIKELGDFTNRIGQVPIGTRAYLEGPHGAFSIDRIPSAGYVLIAGGSGIVPFISMIRTMADRADRRPVLLIYACGKEEGLAYREELDRLADGERPALEVVYVLEEPPEKWSGERGRVTRELLERVLPKEKIVRDYLVCGPVPMIVAVERALRSLGVPANRLHTERFDLV